LGNRIANSSPPTRARTSVRRSRERRTEATLVMTWSPTMWPSVSLTSLNESMSITMAEPSGP
jgi:hypothetical protein